MSYFEHLGNGVLLEHFVDVENYHKGTVLQEAGMTYILDEKSKDYFVLKKQDCSYQSGEKVFFLLSRKQRVTQRVTKVRRILPEPKIYATQKIRGGNIVAESHKGSLDSGKASIFKREKTPYNRLVVVFWNCGYLELFPLEQWQYHNIETCVRKKSGVEIMWDQLITALNGGKMFPLT